MFKSQVGLGVLGIPGAFDVLGMIPGVIIILLIAGMTTWAAWMVGKFKINHPHVYGIDDVGRLLAGSIGREFFFWAFVLRKCRFLEETGFRVADHYHRLHLPRSVRYAEYLDRLQLPL